MSDRFSFRAVLLLLCLNGVAASGCADGGEGTGTVRRATSEESASTAVGSRPAIELVVHTTKEPIRPWKFVVLHHTATESGSVESIDAAHKQRLDVSGRPWKGIGYHFLIGNGNGMPDGSVASTFRWNEQIAGAHAGAADYNQWGVGICLVGNFEEHRPTPKQIAALERLLTELRDEFGLGKDQILRHGDLKATACPGRLFEVERVTNRIMDGKDVRTAVRERPRDVVETGYTLKFMEGAADESSKRTSPARIF
ncbi:MAG: N-acetylmuramoyl-L-alanine amidase [Planctomycetaceae bacterium]|nr:N-acetylmuramoyl-L-alanine amidase [Planctomycetaceae bacterium]